MGHNGGFNPFRDANGEFTTSEGSGKPGRSRRTGPAGTGSTSSKRAGAPPKVPASRQSGTRRDNPYRETQFWSDNTGHREGLSSSQVSYRGKGQNIYGAKAAPRAKSSGALNPGLPGWTPGQPVGTQYGITQLAKPTRAPKGQAKAPYRAPTNRQELIQNFRHPTGSRSAITAARLFLGDTTSTPKQLYQKLQDWEDARIRAGRKNDKEEQVMAGISQVLANTLDV